MTEDEFVREWAKYQYFVDMKNQSYKKIQAKAK